MLSMTKSVAISTLNLSAIKLSESSINSGNFGVDTILGTTSGSSGIKGASILTRFAAEAAAASLKIIQIINNGICNYIAIKNQ